jgi:hypothetical protein
VDVRGCKEFLGEASVSIVSSTYEDEEKVASMGICDYNERTGRKFPPNVNRKSKRMKTHVRKR